MNIKILFNNDDYIVVIKPSGVTSEDTDKAGMPTLLSEGKSPLYTVHRLDREVSGVMVYAKTKQTAAKLSGDMTNGKFHKEYIAVLEGEVPESGVLEDLLFRDKTKNKTYVVKRKRAGVKKAVLEFERIAVVQFGVQPLSLVKIKLITGRTHQIRVQFSNRKFPVYGDRKYGSTKNDGFALWSRLLEFPDTKTGKTVSFTAKPSDQIPFNLFSEYL
jgi:23S rRNA pseudouridine1911/1915/1917 synthase